MQANTNPGSKVIQSWPEESREAAQLVIDKYGEPHETTESMLGLVRRGRVEANGCDEGVLPPFVPGPSHRRGRIGDRLPGTARVLHRPRPVRRKRDRRADSRGGICTMPRRGGEQSRAQSHARHRDRREGFAGAREYYAKEFLDYRRKQPTPYMEKLGFTPAEGSGDPHERVLSDEELQRAKDEGKGAGSGEG
jgi:hypothetical protein